MQPLPRPDNRVIIGMGGSGKSFLARHQTAKAKRLIIFDPNGEDAHLAGAELAESKTDLVGLASVTGNFRICWRGFFRYGDEDAFEFANRVAWAAGDVTVLWDEADQFMTASRMPRHAKRLINMGRHQRCRTLALARRPQDLARGLTANAQRVICFEMQEPLDVAAIGRRIGPSNAAKLPTLGPRRALDWTEGGAVIRKSPFA